MSIDCIFYGKKKKKIPALPLTLPTLIVSAHPKVFIAIFRHELLKVRSLYSIILVKKNPIK